MSNTKQIIVQVSIMMDVRKDKDALEQVHDIINAMNVIISDNEMGAQPQIMTSDLSNADIFETENEKD